MAARLSAFPSVETRPFLLEGFLQVADNTLLRRQSVSHCSGGANPLSGIPVASSCACLIQHCGLLSLTAAEPQVRCSFLAPTGQNVTAMAAAHGVTPAELLAATRAVGRSGSFPAGGWVDRQTPTPPSGAAAAATTPATAAPVPASSPEPPADRNAPAVVGTSSTAGDGGAAAAPAQASANDATGSADQAAAGPSQGPQTETSAPAGAGRGLGTALPRRRARGAGSTQSRDFGAAAARTAVAPPSGPVAIPTGVAAGAHPVACRADWKQHGCDLAVVIPEPSQVAKRVHVSVDSRLCLCQVHPASVRCWACLVAAAAVRAAAAAEASRRR